MLEKPGSLRGALSKSIEDAISLTDMLGVQYLWVDALCIVQDDHEEKVIHLNFMGQIYRHAQLTIIAAAGNDAEAGLPGVFKDRTFHQDVIKVQESPVEPHGLHLIRSPTTPALWLSHYMSGAKWETRGWTLQEKAISRRTLIFREAQVYWSCREASWTEDIYLEENFTLPHFYHLGTAGSGFLNVDAQTMETGDYNDTRSIWDELRSQMVDFSSRELTMAYDAYNAFAGIMQEFSRITGEYLLWATPVTRFELGLCWTRHVRIRNGGTVGSPLKRREESTVLPHITSARSVPFPSWTWLGWIGNVEFRFTDQYRETG